jgi:glutamate dehydrogenase
VLLSYAKIALQHDLLQSRVPDEAHLESWLEAYFPPLLRERYRPGIEGHSLRREIIALGLTNAVVNRGGPAMTARLAAETRRPASDVAQAFVAVREVFDLPALWQRIDALDGKVPGEAQLRLYEATQELVRGRTRWFLQHAGPSQDLPSAIAAHRRGLQALAGGLETVLPPRRKARLDADRDRLAEGGVPGELAAEVARLDVLAQAPAITTIALATGKSVPDTARAFLDIGERLRIADLIAKADAIRTSDQYDGLAIAQAAGRLRAAQDAFTRTALAAGDVEAWSARHRNRLEQVQATLDDIGSTASLTVSRLLVAAGQLSELAEAAPSA